MIDIKNLLANALLATRTNTNKNGDVITSKSVTIETEKGNMKLSSDHKLSKLANLDVPITIIQQMVDNAKFALFEGKPFDFCLGDYTGFVHDADMLNEIVDKYGAKISNGKIVSLRDAHGMDIKHENGTIEEMSLSGKIAMSVFDPNVSLSMDMKRLVCDNGMNTSQSVLGRTTPLINLPLHNLDIVFSQMNLQMEHVSQQRINELVREVVSVHDMDVLFKILSERQGSRCRDPKGLITKSLALLNTKTNTYLRSVYVSDVFEDSGLADRVKGTLNGYIYWNIITQITSHTVSSDVKNTNRLTMLANKAFFEGFSLTTYNKVNDAPKLDIYTDTNRAFYGKGV